MREEDEEDEGKKGERDERTATRKGFVRRW